MWCLKQVSSQRRVASLPTDAEHCEALLRKFPGLLTDKQLAFPHSVIQLQYDGEQIGDLLVARAMPGVQLAQHIAKLDKNSPTDQQKLEKICEDVGEALAHFHCKYADPETGEPTHHRDFHPSNVLYHEATKEISFVDLCGMGTWGPNDDVDKFSRLIRQLASERCEEAFTRQYSATLRKHSPLVGRAPEAVGSRKRPLYSCTNDGEAADGFRTLNILFVPSSGFVPAAHLTTLAWLLCPNRAMLSPSVRRAGVRGKVWILSSGEPGEAWALKQVSVHRRSPDLPTEAQRYEALARRFPELLLDTRLASAQAAIPLQTNCEHVGDLLVSRALPGVDLGRYMASVDASNERAQQRLEKVCREVGALLADFHARYADPETGEVMHHRAFHPGHVLYDEASGALGIIDLCDMGTEGPHDDVERFAAIAERWAGKRHAAAFLMGYEQAMGGQGKVPKLHRPPTAVIPSWWFCGNGYDSDSDCEAGTSGSELGEPREPPCSLM